MSPQELNRLLTGKIEQALHHLFPVNGKVKGGTFTIGNVQGDPGNSLYVYIKDGRFTDSATGEHGDMLELFSLKYGSKAAGIEAAYSFLGIKKNNGEKKLIPWQRPVTQWTKLTENPKCLEYLTKERRLGLDVLEELNVRAKDDTHYVFLTYTHDSKPKLCGANFIALERVEKNGKMKKVIFQSDKPLATLFGHTTASHSVRNAAGKTFIIITEGQIDCMSFRTQGIKNVVSIPFGIGAGDWIENSFDFLMQYQEVYLAFDNEEVSQKARDKAAARIGYERCKKLEMPAEYKDANEAHLAGYDLQLTVDAAIEFKPDKLVESNDIFEETIVRLSKGRRELQGIPFLGLVGEHSIEFRVRPKEMTIYTGYPKSGKSNILYQFVAYLVFVLNKTVIIASLEEDAEDILGLIMIHAIGIQYDINKPNVRNAFAAMRQIMKGRIFFYYHRNRAPFRDVLMHAEFAIRKHGAEHFIMDSVARTDLNIEDNEKANEFMGLITTSMNETGAHYHVVAHSKKGSDKNKWEQPGLQEIKGAAAFGIETFNCLSMWRDPRKSELIQEFRKKGYVEKIEWINAGDAPPGYGGFGNNRSGSVKKVTQMDWEYVKEYPDSILWVCAQRVGGVTGKYPFYYNKENNRMSPVPEEVSHPYAYEIYMEFIEGHDDEEEEEIQL